LDKEALRLRAAALSSHIEMVVSYKYKIDPRVPKPWQITVRRNHLVEDVISRFSRITPRTSYLLAAPTEAHFEDNAGNLEEGIDHGGLSSDLFCVFWRAALSPSAHLFESAPDADNGWALLPSPAADRQQMRSLGRAMLKCIIDRRLLCRGLSPFVYEFLLDTHERRVLDSLHTALDALSDFDPVLASSWSRLLCRRAPLDGLSLADFVEGATEEPVTAGNIGEAVLRGCRHRLLDKRLDALTALAEGFSEFIDIRSQLAAFSPPQLRALVEGSPSLPASALVDCFELTSITVALYGPSASAVWRPYPSSTPATASAAAAATSAADADATDAADSSSARSGSVAVDLLRWLREILADETLLSEKHRWQLLEWCTALPALPFDGLRRKIRLRLNSSADTSALPEVRTCDFELFLPPYASREQLLERLLVALSHRHDGFFLE